MRWPFGPPHLTLKPSKKKKKKTKKQKRNKEGPSEAPHLKKKRNKQKKEKVKNTKIPKKSFSIISQNFLFFGGGCPKIPFLTTWPRKRAPKKHYKNRGFSKAFLEKQLCVTKRPLLDKKNKSRNSSYHFFCIFLLFQQQKHQN